MRLWSLHPSLLDRPGLLGCWRETLLAQKVLAGHTKGYTNHPQLVRFRDTGQPMEAIATYLWGLVDEARQRGYNFDDSKILHPRSDLTIDVTTGQVDYEAKHLARKLQHRHPEYLEREAWLHPGTHPMFTVIDGDIEPWEVVSE